MGPIIGGKVVEATRAGSLNESAARDGFFGEVAGSGGHVAALTMSLMVEARLGGPSRRARVGCRFGGAAAVMPLSSGRIETPPRRAGTGHPSDRSRCARRLSLVDFAKIGDHGSMGDQMASFLN